MRLEIAFDDTVRFDVGNVAEKGEAEGVFDVVLALDRVIEIIDEERETDAGKHSAEDAEDDGENHFRFYWASGNGSGIDEYDVIRGKTAQEFGFVAAQKIVAVNGFVVFGFAF